MQTKSAVQEYQGGHERLDEMFNPPAASRAGIFLPYLLILLLIPFIYYFAVFPFVIFPQYGFERFGGSKWGPALNYSFHADHVNADVVIFGDSSAFLGIDPKVVSERLGMKTVVLPDTVGSLPVTHDQPLQNYLKQNTPPRLLVLYFSRWNLDYERYADSHLFLEGEENLLQNGSKAQIETFAEKYPTEFLVFPWHFGATLGLRQIKLGWNHPHRADEIAQSLGHVDFSDPYGPITGRCHIPDFLLERQTQNSVQALIDKYQTPQTKLVVYLAPVPGCENASRAQGSTGVLQTYPPKVLPASSFAADGFYAHVMPQEVPTASRLLADAIAVDLAKR
jgi:hypothetical protein